MQIYVAEENKTGLLIIIEKFKCYVMNKTFPKLKLQPQVLVIVYPSDLFGFSSEHFYSNIQSTDVSISIKFVIVIKTRARGSGSIKFNVCLFRLYNGNKDEGYFTS